MDKNMNKPVVVETKGGAAKVFDREFVKTAQKHDRTIKANFASASKSFFAIASNLYWFNDCGAYQTFGSDNIWDFARDRYDLSKASTSNYINIVGRFCRPALESDSWVLRDEYLAYSPSQLAQMLPYTDSQVSAAGIIPKMSCRDINKALKAMLPDKQDKPDKPSDAEDSPANPTNPVPDAPDDEDDDPGDLRNVMMVIRGADDYPKKEKRMLDFVHNLFAKNPDACLEIAYYEH